MKKPEKKPEVIDRGELDLSEYPNLETVMIDGYCFKTGITQLKVSGCLNLKELDCPNNQLTSLDLTQNSKLEKLNIEGNKFSEWDASFLNQLVNTNKAQIIQQKSKI